MGEVVRRYLQEQTKNLPDAGHTHHNDDVSNVLSNQHDDISQISTVAHEHGQHRHSAAAIDALGHSHEEHMHEPGIGAHHENSSERLSIGALLALLASSIVLVQILTFLVPRLVTRKSSPFYLSLLNCLSGAIFFGTALTHLVPDELELEQQLIQAGKLSIPEGYPLSLVLIGVGYYFIIFLEKLAFGKLSHHHESSDSNFSNDTSPRDEEVAAPDSVAAGADIESMSKTSSDDVARRWISHPRQLSGPIILCGALGLHQVLESVLLGTAETRQSLIAIFISIILHRPAASIAIGAQFVKAGATLVDMCIYGIFLCLCTPAGILIGSALDYLSATTLVLNAIGIGIFFYAGATEINGKEVAEMSNGHHKLSAAANRCVKFLFMLIGFGIVALLSLNEHSHVNSTS